MRTLMVHQGERPLIGIIEDERLVEVFFPEKNDSAEAILLGRVERIVPGMKAAFVAIGQEKNGFLPLEEKNTGLGYPKTGDAVIVQIRKEAQGVKGAYLTRDISLCGENMLLMPMNRMIAVSSKIQQDDKRQSLKELGRDIAQNRFGLVMRTAAENAAESDIRQEAEELFARWRDIAHAAPIAHVPSVISRPRTVLETVIDDYRPKGIDLIVTDDPTQVKQLESVAPVHFVAENLLMVYKIGQQLKRAQERHVWLNSGGTLVIDPCEAMTVIDVNTAKYTGSRQLEDTVLHLNMEACTEIARQIRLRNVSGIIIIDMIDMKTQEHRNQVLNALADAFAADRIKTVIHGMTSLGLIEMTRKRSRPPLQEMLKDAPASSADSESYIPNGGTP